MRIGIDCRLWNETGVGRYIRNLVLNLQKIDKKNEYALFVLSKDYSSIISHLSSLISHLVKSDIRWHTIEEQLKFPAIINKENLDLMHFPYFSVPIFYNRAFVVTIHDLIINHFSTGRASTLSDTVYKLKLLTYKLILKTAAQKAKKIIAVSNTTKKEITDHLNIDSSKIVVTYEGVDSALQNSKVKSENSKLQFKNQKYFLYIGNAYPHKNLERLLKGFSAFCHPEASAEGSHKILRSAQNDTRLVLVGKEDYFYKRLKKTVQQMNLFKNVIFMQDVTDEELSSLYKNALALVLPSLMEGFGLTTLEAMANKCLVLASGIPSIREICGDAAIYFNPFDIKDMTQKMKDVYLNNIYYLSNKKEKGLERVKLFSWERMAQETLAVYEQSVINP